MNFTAVKEILRSMKIPSFLTLNYFWFSFEIIDQFYLDQSDASFNSGWNPDDKF